MTTPPDRTVHFVHVGDSHLRGGPDDVHLHRLRAMVGEVGRLLELGVPIDFVVHTGDLADAADASDATSGITRRGLDVLGALPVPWHVLGGNHDRRAFLVGGTSATGAIVSAPHPDGASPGGEEGGRPAPHVDDAPALLAAGVARRAYGPLDCLFVNANPEDGERDLHGAIVGVQIEAVADHLDALAPERCAALFLHYPPMEQPGAWAGRPAGGGALHAALASRAARVAGVFAGHVHRGISHAVDGLLYVSGPALSRGFALWPGLGHGFDDGPTVPWHYVSIGPDGTRVQAHAFVPDRAGLS